MRMTAILMKRAIKNSHNAYLCVPHRYAHRAQTAKKTRASTKVLPIKVKGTDRKQSRKRTVQHFSGLKFFI